MKVLYIADTPNLQVEIITALKDMSNMTKRQLIMIYAGDEIGFIPNCLLIYKLRIKGEVCHDKIKTPNNQSW